MISGWWTVIRKTIDIVSNKRNTIWRGILLLFFTRWGWDCSVWHVYVHITSVSYWRWTIPMNTHPLWWFVFTIEIHLCFKFFDKAYDLKLQIKIKLKCCLKSVNMFGLNVGMPQFLFALKLYLPDAFLDILDWNSSLRPYRDVTQYRLCFQFQAYSYQRWYHGNIDHSPCFQNGIPPLIWVDCTSIELELELMASMIQTLTLQLGRQTIAK